MKIVRFGDYDELSLYGSKLVIDELIRKPDLSLCAATGSSPLGLYQELAKAHADSRIQSEGLRLIKLDEWAGVPKNDPSSCEYYLQQNIVRPLNLAENQLISFDPLAEDLEKECGRIQGWLKAEGKLDLVILGLGKNGHLGFNEPSTDLHAHCHVARLTSTSQQHEMVSAKSTKPQCGLTIGMGDILNSEMIILIVSGKGKEEAKRSLFTERISTQCPASFLWLHDHVHCLLLE